MKIGNSLINARAGTVATKPSFRSAFKKRRCLIATDGFYEWQPVLGQRTKQPYHIGIRGAPVFAFAGLWEYWMDPDGKLVESCTIVTIPSAASLRVKCWHE